MKGEDAEMKEGKAEEGLEGKLGCIQYRCAWLQSSSPSRWPLEIMAGRTGVRPGTKCLPSPKFPRDYRFTDQDERGIEPGPRINS